MFHAQLGCIGIQQAWRPYLLHLPAFQLVIAPFSLYCAQPAGELLYLFLVIPQLVLQPAMDTSGQPRAALERPEAARHRHLRLCNNDRRRKNLAFCLCLKRAAARLFCSLTISLVLK